MWNMNMTSQKFVYMSNKNDGLTYRRSKDGFVQNEKSQPDYMTGDFLLRPFQSIKKATQLD